jgi:hypothetical protein
MKWTIEEKRPDTRLPETRALVTEAIVEARCVPVLKGEDVVWEAIIFPTGFRPEWLGQFRSLVDAQDKVEKCLAQASR